MNNNDIQYFIKQINRLENGIAKEIGRLEKDIERLDDLWALSSSLQYELKQRLLK